MRAGTLTGKSTAAPLIGPCPEMLLLQKLVEVEVPKAKAKVQANAKDKVKTEVKAEVEACRLEFEFEFELTPWFNQFERKIVKTCELVT